jgi:hypothetical protein
VGGRPGDAGHNKQVSVTGAVDGLRFRREGRFLVGGALGARNGWGGVIGKGSETPFRLREGIDRELSSADPVSMTRRCLESG